MAPPFGARGQDALGGSICQGAGEAFSWGARRGGEIHGRSSWGTAYLRRRNSCNCFVCLYLSVRGRDRGLACVGCKHTLTEPGTTANLPLLLRCRSGEMVDALDSKSSVRIGRVGSSPTSGTNPRRSPAFASALPRLERPPRRTLVAEDLRNSGAGMRTGGHAAARPFAGRNPQATWPPGTGSGSCVGARRPPIRCGRCTSAGG